MEICVSAPAQMGLGEIGDWAPRMERLGVDVIHIPETIHDPFTIAAMALTHTTRVTVRTSMALAFPRSPMIIAYAAWDLAKYSEGRFQLGIASQVRGNIVGRFSVPVVRTRVASSRLHRVAAGDIPFVSDRRGARPRGAVLPIQSTAALLQPRSDRLRRSANLDRRGE